LVIALIFVSSTFVEANKVLSRHHRSHHHRSHHKSLHRNKSIISNVIAAIGGVIAVLGGTTVATINSCLPKAVQIPGSDEEAGGTNLGGCTGPLKTIMSILGFALKIACAFKSKIISFLQGKISRRRWRRRFFLGLSNGYTKGFLSSIGKAFKKVGNAIKNGVTKVATAIKNVAVKVYNTVKDGIMAAINFIANTFKKIVQAIKDIKNKITGFFNGPIFQEIKRIFQCIISLGQVAKAVVASIRGFIDAIKLLLSGWAGVINILVNCICNWERFKNAIEAIVDAFKTNGDTRWNKIGTFIGHLMMAIQ
jgi:hypothetical protein